MTFDEHIEDIVSRCKKRLNLLKALCGRTWGASTVTIMYTYKSFIRPILEYGSILYAYSSDDQIKKIQAVETQAIKIAHRLPPWTTNTFCYEYVGFEKISDRLKTLAKNFLRPNSN